MINGLHQYSTESLIKELEKRGFDCEDIQIQADAKRLGSEPISLAGFPRELFDPEQAWPHGISLCSSEDKQILVIAEERLASGESIEVDINDLCD